MLQTPGYFYHPLVTFVATRESTLFFHVRALQPLVFNRSEFSADFFQIRNKSLLDHAQVFITHYGHLWLPGGKTGFCFYVLYNT